MHTLAPEEKVSIVMAYTLTGLIRGELVTREGVRVNTLLRTEGASDYIHLYKSQWIQISGGPLKPLAYSEVILPTSIVLGFHLAPPAEEPLDYDEGESNRISAPLTVLMGMFVVKGKVRISAKSDIGILPRACRSHMPSGYPSMKRISVLPTIRKCPRSMSRC